MTADSEKITLVDFVKENTSLFSAFSIFIAASAAIRGFVPGVIGDVLSICFTILSAVFLFELYNLIIDKKFKNKADSLIGIVLSTIFSLLAIHIGLYLKSKSDFVFYITLWIGLFIFIFTAFWILFRFRGIKTVGRRIIFALIFLLSLFLTIGIYAGHDSDVDDYINSHYEEYRKS